MPQICPQWLARIFNRVHNQKKFNIYNPQTNDPKIINRKKN
jgi:hypothetical protein